MFTDMLRAGRGDKAAEMPLVSIEAYVSALKQVVADCHLPPPHSVFLTTEDGRAVQEMRRALSLEQVGICISFRMSLLPLITSPSHTHFAYFTFPSALPPQGREWRLFTLQGAHFDQNMTNARDAPHQVSERGDEGSARNTTYGIA